MAGIGPLDNVRPTLSELRTHPWRTTQSGGHSGAIRAPARPFPRPPQAFSSIFLCIAIMKAAAAAPVTPVVTASVSS